MNKRIIIEENAIKKLDEIILNYSKVLVITTPNLHELFDWINNIIRLGNVELLYLKDYSVIEATNISNYLITNNFDLIVSIGGGIINDTCKLAAKYSEKSFLSVPTIISNDGVCSNISVLKVDENRTDGLPAKSPDIVLIDINIIKNAPLKYLKAGICDIVSNYTALYDWNLAVENNKETNNDIARIISSNVLSNVLNSTVIDQKSSEYIKIICEALILSGIAMEIKGNTRPCSGSEHLFNHAINMYYPNLNILHGYLVGLGALTTSILQGQDYKLLVNYFKKNGIDVRPSTLGISIEIFVDAWKKASSTRPTRYTILNELQITKTRLTNIYKKIEEELKQ